MAFTQADVIAIETAIKELAAGVASVKYADRDVTYADMDKLVKLRAVMIRDVAGSRKSVVHVAVKRYQ